MSDGWTALVLAGQRPGENAFAAAHGVRFKAMIPVAGEPMLGRVVRTLLASDAIERILILAQDPDALLAGPLAWLREEPRVAAVASGDSIAQSVADVAGGTSAPFPILVTTGDHALLTPAVVGSFLSQVAGADAAVAVVERATMEAAHPETQRTWLKFRGGHYSGANLFALRTEASGKALDLWSRTERDRKKALRLMLAFGPMLAVRALTRTISLNAALDRLGRRVGLHLCAVALPFAEAAIDVDKQADLELAERILAARAG
jgi:GTP:adenosylcobinamide-phosphate guanylyltransferase